MAQGNWAAQQSANAVVAVNALEIAMQARGYVPQYASTTVAGINEVGLVADAVNALLNCIPQSFAISFTPAATSNAVVVEQTLVVTGSNGVVGDRVLVNYPGAPTANVGMLMGARVSTAGANATISIPFVNP